MSEGPEAETLDAIVAEVVLEGRAAWPAISVDEEIVRARVAALPVAPLHRADFYLACACAAGDLTAVTAFDRHVLSIVAAVVARIDSAPTFADEVAQLLRTRLLVGPPPRILEYTGRGALGGWVRVAAARIATDLVRARRPVLVPDDDIADVWGRSGSDTELAVLRARHADEIATALRAAIFALAPKERNLLRLHFVDGWSIDQLGRTYRVHRATAARWIVAARQRVLDEVCRAIGEQLRLSPTSVHSLFRDLKSGLDVSLRSLFAA